MSKPIATIRMATQTDTAELTRMRWQLITEDAGTPLDQRFNTTCHNWFNEIVSSNRWHVVVAASSTSSLSGCMCLQIVDKAPNANGLSCGWGYLTNCFVKKSERNNNIGQMMLRKILELGRQLNLELILVWPSEKSVRFYNRIGFQSTELAHAEEGDAPPLEFCYRDNL